MFIFNDQYTFKGEQVKVNHCSCSYIFLDVHDLKNKPSAAS